MTDLPPSADSAVPGAARPARRRRWWWIGLASIVVVALAGAAVWYFVFRDTAPPKVDIDRAAESVDGGGTASSGTTSTTASSTAAKGLDGTWGVDSTIGDFNVSAGTFTSAFVGYRVNEQLAGVGAKTAYGRTPDVTGSLTIAGTVVTAAEFTADLTTLQSDDSRRDGQLRNQSIQTSRFPTATFTLTQPVDFGTIPTDESTVSVNATGDLTLHGVTKTVTIPLDAKLVKDTIVVTSLFDITFADYDITKPSSTMVLSIEDKGIMEVQLFFTRS
ncbi:MAG: YceI family protein [Acidimicrobiia bacterium]